MQHAPQLAHAKQYATPVSSHAYLRKHDFVDADRIGVMGLSFEEWMTWRSTGQSASELPRTWTLPAPGYRLTSSQMHKDRAEKDLFGPVDLSWCRFHCG